MSMQGVVAVDDLVSMQGVTVADDQCPCRVS